MTNKQIILCMYRSPSGNFHPFLRLFEIMLMFLHRPKTEFVICGYVNLNYLSDSYRKPVSLLVGSYNMLHTVNFSMRLQNKHSSVMDAIFVSTSRLHLCDILPLCNGLSDHNAHCLISEKKIKENNVRQIQGKTLHKR